MSRTTTTTCLLILTSLLLVVVAPPAWAAAGAGELDPAFGAGGTVTTSIGAGTDRAVAVAIQPGDGKIVVVGSTEAGTGDDWAIVRYNTNGTPDATFGAGGIVTQSFGSGTDHAHAVAIDGGGNIVVAGYAFNGTSNDFALARYDSSGAPDTSFSGDGKLTTSLSTNDDEINGMAIAADGKIIVVGQSANATSNLFALARYNTNGTLDSNFNGTGKLTTNVGAGSDVANAVAIQADGKIVAAGRASNGTDRDFAVVRYTTNGTPDTTFSGDGKATTPIGPKDDEARGVAIQGDGKIVAAGSSDSGVSTDFALVRYTAAGGLDSTFDGDGIVTTNIGHNDDAFGIAIDAGGDIVVAGTAGSSYFGVARYLPDGGLDLGFAGTGTVYTAVSPFGNDGLALAIQPADGNIVVVGDAYVSDYDFAIARYLVGPAVPAYQPDEAIRAPHKKAYVGDNAYNTSALGQTVAVKAQRRASITLSIRVENDGSVSDSFTLLGAGPQTGFAAKYVQGTTNVTSQVIGGTFTTSSLAPGASVVVKLVVTVKATAKIGSLKSWLVTATSTTSSPKKDAVKAKVKVAA